MIEDSGVLEEGQNDMGETYTIKAVKNAVLDLVSQRQSLKDAAIANLSLTPTVSVAPEPVQHAAPSVPKPLTTASKHTLPTKTSHNSPFLKPSRSQSSTPTPRGFSIPLIQPKSLSDEEIQEWYARQREVNASRFGRINITKPISPKKSKSRPSSQKTAESSSANAPKKPVNHLQPTPNKTGLSVFADIPSSTNRAKGDNDMTNEYNEEEEDYDDVDKNDGVISVKRRFSNAFASSEEEEEEEHGAGGRESDASTDIEILDMDAFTPEHNEDSEPYTPPTKSTRRHTRRRRRSSWISEDEDDQDYNSDNNDFTGSHYRNEYADTGADNDFVSTKTLPHETLAEDLSNIITKSPVTTASAKSKAGNDVMSKPPSSSSNLAKSNVTAMDVGNGSAAVKATTGRVENAIAVQGLVPAQMEETLVKPDVPKKVLKKQKSSEETNAADKSISRSPNQPSITQISAVKPLKNLFGEGLAKKSNVSTKPSQLNGPASQTRGLGVAESSDVLKSASKRSKDSSYSVQGLTSLGELTTGEKSCPPSMSSEPLKNTVAVTANDLRRPPTDPRLASQAPDGPIPSVMDTTTGYGPSKESVIPIAPALSGVQGSTKVPTSSTNTNVVQPEHSVSSTKSSESNTPTPHIHKETISLPSATSKHPGTRLVTTAPVKKKRKKAPSIFMNYPRDNHRRVSRTSRLDAKKQQGSDELDADADDDDLDSLFEEPHDDQGDVEVADTATASTVVAPPSVAADTTHSEGGKDAVDEPTKKIIITPRAVSAHKARGSSLLLDLEIEDDDTPVVDTANLDSLMRKLSTPPEKHSQYSDVMTMTPISTAVSPADAKNEVEGYTTEKHIASDDIVETQPTENEGPLMSNSPGSQKDDVLLEVTSQKTNDNDNDNDDDVVAIPISEVDLLTASQKVFKRPADPLFVDANSDDENDEMSTTIKHGDVILEVLSDNESDSDVELLTEREYRRYLAEQKRTRT
ncbi:hypothetical protein BON22_4271 [Cyberlindnera fabianii]|uniref:Uncharacterized protein n=1 Tax=Cyberlindnera fabianii TaxID=36022 RepID=A0A1V2L1D4_CYBFA|nr:hypothetical protein BON22_4271 [Cyberlindnera fabianii]